VTRRAARFTQADVARAVKAALGAGLPVTGIRVDAEGFTVLTESARSATRHGPGMALGAEAIEAALAKAKADGLGVRMKKGLKRPRVP
jgi:hypothetical protein